MICPSKSQRTHSSGFTLIELMVVMVLISTMSVLVAPNFWNLYTKSMEQQDLLDYTETLSKLRVSAWKTGKTIELSASQPANWPVMPEGWTVLSLPNLKFLASGITNGGRIVLQAQPGQRWLIDIAPLDGKVTLTREQV